MSPDSGSDKAKFVQVFAMSTGVKQNSAIFSSTNGVFVFGWGI